MPYNTTMINPFLNQTPLVDASQPSQLSWEEWDQVITNAIIHRIINSQSLRRERERHL
jgi:hypothetical protein